VKVISTPLAGLLILEPVVHADERGFFIESWNRRTFAALGLEGDFVQDNHARSGRGVLRGLHYQLRQPQGKLARVTHGAVFDVAVDLRRASPTFGRWFGCELSAVNQRQLWTPPGFAHGYQVISDQADFLYKTTAYYDPADEHALRWNDPTVGIAWLLPELVLLSAKDQVAPLFGDITVFP
jgi:dTDP-4-dehydrorhamnose 3,5-epimerase